MTSDHRPGTSRPCYLPRAPKNVYKNPSGWRAENGRRAAGVPPRPLPTGIHAREPPVPAEGGTRPGVRRPVPHHPRDCDEHRRRRPPRVLPPGARGGRAGHGLFHERDSVARALRTDDCLLPRRLVAGRLSDPRPAPPRAQAPAPPGARVDPRRPRGGPRRADEAPGVGGGARAFAEGGEGRGEARVPAHGIAEGPLRGEAPGAAEEAAGDRRRAHAARERSREGVVLMCAMEYKQVIVVREDLNISEGKRAAQVAHAAVGAALEARESHTKWYKEWLREGQRKVVLRARDLQELRELHEQARTLKLPAVMIDDAGLTELPPGTTTCLGIGPAPEDQVDRVTRRLPLW